MRKTLCFLFLLTLPLCACGKRLQNPAAYRVVVASDLHYIAPSLTDQGTLFTAVADNGDGKLMRWIEELTDAFLAEVSEQQPDALILTGDLSFNGAVESHKALAEKLRAVQNSGVPVFVLPGNHDLNNRNAGAFSGDSFSPVPSASDADFRQIYGEFGFGQALSCDQDSLSYIAALNDTTRILMLDFNTGHDPCGISDSTLQWVKEELQSARSAGAAVLAAGHQNLFQQTMFRENYVVSGAERLAKLLRRYGVPLYLSGHLHCQHRKTEKGLTEIATSALSVSPCQYGVLRSAEGRIRYETRETDVTAWAKKQGRQEEELLDFKARAAAYFDEHSRRQISESLALFPYTKEEAEAMTEYLSALSRAYFSGNLRGLEGADPDGRLRSLWERCPSPYGAYLATILPDLGEDFRYWEST